MSELCKPIGGVVYCVLYPADAVESALFSVDGCKLKIKTDWSKVIDVEVVNGASLYEEECVIDNGVFKVEHRLSLVVHRRFADALLDPEFLKRASVEGVIAFLYTADGRTLLVGYSQRFADEQPLLLEKVLSSSQHIVEEYPTVTLQFASHDTDFSVKMDN